MSTFYSTRYCLLTWISSRLTLKAAAKKIDWMGRGYDGSKLFAFTQSDSGTHFGIYFSPPKKSTWSLWWLVTREWIFLVEISLLSPEWTWLFRGWREDLRAITQKDIASVECVEHTHQRVLGRDDSNHYRCSWLNFPGWRQLTASALRSSLRSSGHSAV